MSEERRLVTVLFSDVAGSTALGEQVDPEDLRALMGRYFAIAQEAVAAHGGTLEKFIGDAVMAVFGLPRAHGDDPDRALLAALQLRDEVRDDPILADRLPIRLGVASGEVVASRDAGEGRDFLITGDAVNTAARLQQGAESWQIVVAERTLRAVDGRFAFGPATTAGVRGKSAPVASAVLLGPAPSRQMRRSPIVGRDDDIAQLQLIAKRAFRERRPYLVSVIAPPGTGKSRLLEEFLDRLPDVSADAAIAIAQCLPYGQRLTYWPMRGLLLGLLGLADDLSPERLRAATHDWLEQLGDPDPGRDSELLVATVGAGEAEVSDRTTLYAAWRRAIELAAADRPLVLAVEDLHWSSDSLLDLVEAILAPRSNVPLVMVSLARPELLDRRPSWGGGRRDYVSLELAPLEPEALEALVGDLLEAPAPELVQAVVSRSDGNPFYAGEIVRSVLDRTGGSTHGDAIAAALATLPDTVQATVLARLDLLGPVPRRVLQVGAVLGRTFQAGGLDAIEGGREDAAPDFTAALDELVERDLIRPSGPDAYSFRHILIREVAYGTLPRAERARAHQAAARWLETTAGMRVDEFAELIAYHYREAASLGSVLGTAVAPEIRRAAVTWLKRAAEVAMAAAAQLEAARHLEAAIELADPDELPEMYEELARDLPAGPESVRSYLEALRLARERGRPADVELRILARGLVEMTRWHGAIGHAYHGESQRLTAEGRALLPRVTDERARATFLTGDAFRVWTAHEPIAPSELDAARAAAEEAVAIARRLDDPILLSEALDGIGSLDLALDDYRASLRGIDERLALGDRLDFAERLDAATMSVWHRSILGDVRDAAEYAREIANGILPGEAPSFALSIGAWLVADLHTLGRWDEAIAAFGRVFSVWVEMGRPPAGYAINGFVAAFLIGRARQDIRVTDMAREGIVDIAAGLGAGERGGRMTAFIPPDYGAIVADVVGLWRVWQGRIDHVERGLAVCVDALHEVDETMLRSIAAYADEKGALLVGAQARRGLGVFRSDPEPLREALAAFDRIGAVPAAARARIELGRLIGDRVLVARGTATLEDLGDVDQLARYATTEAAP